MLMRDKQDSSFLKKRRKPARREAKDFYFPVCPTIVAMACIYPHSEGIKVFWFFSSEKNAFPACSINGVI
jgi:hypothetical protein